MGSLDEMNCYDEYKDTVKVPPRMGIRRDLSSDFDMALGSTWGSSGFPSPKKHKDKENNQGLANQTLQTRSSPDFRKGSCDDSEYQGRVSSAPGGLDMMSSYRHSELVEKYMLTPDKFPERKGKAVAYGY